MDEVVIQKAFREAAVAASHILRFAVEHPEAIAKHSAHPDSPETAVAVLAKALATRVADLAVPSHEAMVTARAERVAKWERDQAARPPLSEADKQIAREEDEMYARVMAEKWTAKAAEAKAALIDDTRPHLDADRAVRDGRIQSVPWREEPEDDDVEKVGWTDEARAAALETRRRNQGKWMPTPQAPAGGAPWLPTKPAPPSRTPWRETPTVKALIEAGFSDEGDGEWIHRSLHHVVKMETDGSFLIRSGWRTDEVLKGTAPEDVAAALEAFDE